jgi:GT2 family glycosyltransferase
VQAKWLMNTLVTIPAYGEHALTRAVVADCRREKVRVLVVDNQGDYPATQNELVLRSRENLGWAAACNAGIELALADQTIERVVLLNNDVQLSASFFAGLIVAEKMTGAKLVGSSVDGFAGSAGNYSPRPVHLIASVVASPAVLIAREVIERVGSFDVSLDRLEALADFESRARHAGFQPAITAASYAYPVGVPLLSSSIPKASAIP